MKKITAIVRRDLLEQVENRLKSLGVPGITVTAVKGYGEYANFFSHDWLVPHAKIDIFATDTEAHKIAAAIVEAARTGAAGDGIVAIGPTESVVHIRTGRSLERPP